MQLKIRDAFENEGDAAEKSRDVCRDIAALQGSFRTYTGDGECLFNRPIGGTRPAV
jgi:hypothetical protein